MFLFVKSLFLVSIALNVAQGANKVAYDARNMFKQIDWVTVSSLSIKSGIEGYPLGNLKSVSDGPTENSTGIPYFFTSNVDLSCQDYLVDNRASVFATMASTGYCKDNGFDPQDPRCPRLFMTGRYVRVEDEAEKQLALRGLFEKHPEMQVWAELPDFYVSKLAIEKIIFLQTYGPTADIPVDEYLNLSQGQRINHTIERIKVCLGPLFVACIAVAVICAFHQGGAFFQVQV